MTGSTAESRPTALVTGASRGLGKAIAVALAQAGYDLAITAGTPEQIGAAVAWLCTDPAADQHRGSIVLAQKLSHDLDLL